MFDQNPSLNNQPQVPANSELPKAENVQDIFQETESAPKPTSPIQASSQPVSPLRSIPTMSGPREPLMQLPDDLVNEGNVSGSRKFFWIGLIAVVAVLLVGGYYAYSKFFAPSVVETPPALEVENQANTKEPQAQEQAQEPQMPQEPTPSIVDSDKDGLTDEEERQYGTEIFEPDSDGDGLYDLEEVKVYKTDPLNPDTDNDGYMDGREVENGYNPAGEGLLLDVNSQS